MATAVVISWAAMASGAKEAEAEAQREREARVTVGVTTSLEEQLRNAHQSTCCKRDPASNMHFAA